MTADSLSRKPAPRLSDAQAREAVAGAPATTHAPPDRGKPRGLTRVLRACGASWRGLAGAYREEAAFRQELAFAVIVIPCGVWFGRTGVERALLIAPMLFILTVELINSAIEATAKRWPAPLGRIRAFAFAGLEPRRMGFGPVFAITRALDQAGLALDDIDLIEINEAFAAQVLACLEASKSADFARRELGRDRALGEIPREKLNVNGGAIALGHPVGASGARLLLTLLLEMRRRGLKRGVAALCVGGGQGAAFVVER